jgi:hypothetical protein
MPDGSVPDLPLPVDLAGGETAAPIFAELTFSGCATLDVATGRPRCTGTAPLNLGLVPIVPAGIASWLWTMPGGTPDSSKSSSPKVRFDLPGSYPVTLVCGGASGSATADGEVEVLPAPLAAPCSEDAQCDSGTCLCAPGSDGGQACPGALGDGLCTRSCAGTSCGAGQVCADLSRSAAHDAQVGAQPWRHPICLPSCLTDVDCRPGFSCRELPTLAMGGVAGGPFVWANGCFADGVLASVGESCISPGGDPDPTRCTTGQCANLGARDLCTLSCANDACPKSAACATFAGDQQDPLCLARCDMTHPCADPLLGCQLAGGVGQFAFTVGMAEPPGTTLCAPKRCTGAMDCAPAGMCDGPDGGSYCSR